MASRGKRMVARVTDWLYEPEDAAALALFRIGFGIVMTWDIVRFLVARWVQEYFFSGIFLFKYAFFEWVHPLPPPAMWVVLVVTAFAAFGVTVGALYRVCAPILFLGHTYLFLLSASHYLNHAYLISVLAFLMMFVPAHRALSVDAWLWPEISRRTLPRWPRALMIFQVGAVYFFGGIAKINSDWLVYRMPTTRWLASEAKSVPWGGEIVGSEWFSYLIPWGGCAFDLLIVPALLWRRTRPIATLVAVGFHFTNFYLFSIGVFPWMMLAVTPVFFDPSWSRRIVGIGPLLGRWVDRGARSWLPSVTHRRRVTRLLLAWVALQIFLPLRHHLYPGDVAWTEEGHMYSWRMKLRSKKGHANFRVVDADTGRTWQVNPREELTRRQVRKLVGRPDLLVQYAHHLDRRYREEFGVADPQVFGDVFVSLNYRKRVRFIDPEFDLSSQRPTLARFPWILPLKWTPPPER